MSAELILAIASLCGTVLIGILTVIANIRIGKLNNTEARHKYEKEITYFELQFKDEHWLAQLIATGEFGHYSLKSQRRIYKWWLDYSKEHMPVELRPVVEYDLSKLASPGPNWLGDSGESNDDAPDPGDLF